MEIYTRRHSSDDVAFAALFAKAAHKGQMYGETKEYYYHCDRVYRTLILFFCWDDDILAAGYLHDVLEDTKVDKDTFRLLFPQNVVELVELVTNKEGKNRAERHALTYPGIRANEKAITLKLADRIANVCYSRKMNQPILGMYRKEQSSFRDFLWYPEFPRQDMWEELDRLLK